VAKLVHITSLIDVVMAPLARAPGPPPHPGMEWVPGGTFRMGADGFHPEEEPVRSVTVGSFWMDRHPVTNAAFARFVEATGYVTVAERALDPADYPGIAELLVPGSVVFQPPRQGVDPPDRAACWRFVPGACWRHPLGPGSTLEGLAEHPVVHVTGDDADVYAAWAGKEIPTEAEWEFAARGGLDGRAYGWGDELWPGGRVMAHAAPGELPHPGRTGGGWTRTAPVGSYPANGYGLYDLIGNVWEWTADEWGASPPAECSRCALRAGSRAPAPGRGADRDPRPPQTRIPRRVLKGGSYLCAPACARHRPSARIPQLVDTGTVDQGFRCVVRVSPGETAGR
jgi:formylglycine-generating enzyme required for sulfatase activity